MLSENELMQLCEDHELSPSAIAIVQNIRRSEPSRNVRSGAHNVATHYASRKMGCVIKAEAMRTELALIYEWDHDKATYEFYDQPPKIKKIQSLPNGRTHSYLYTPDFFVIARDFIGWVESKHEQWLQKQAAEPRPDYVQDEQGAWRCPAAERYAEEAGLGFMVRSSAQSDPILIQNIADLSDYWKPECPPAPAEQLEAVYQLLGQSGWCWLSDLLHPSSGVSADMVLKMIADEQILVDLRQNTIMNEARLVRVFRTKALMNSSELWLPSEGESLDKGFAQIRLENGEGVLWDGKPYEILNVGDSQVSLRTAQGEIQSLAMHGFDVLLKQGSIVPSGQVADPKMQLAAQRLRTASEKDIQQARHRYAVLHPDSGLMDDAPKACERAIRKWKVLARMGLELYGNEFIGLLPDTALRGNRDPRFEPRVLELMQEVIDEEVKVHQSTYATAWGILTARCAQEGLVPPSQKTFCAQIRLCSTPETLQKSRMGEKAGYALEQPYLSISRETPKHGTRPFELAHIDHTQVDVQLVDERTGANMSKAWLTVMIDAFTRCILAWVFTFDPPSYRSCMLVTRDCVRRHARFPATVIVDQGSDFKSKYFDVLVAQLGANKRIRPGSKPRFGSVIERFFGVSSKQLFHSLRGNNQSLQAPRSMSPTHDPRDLAVWNLRTLNELFGNYIDHVYHASEHPALGVSPAQMMGIGLMQSGQREHMRIPYTREFVISTLPYVDKESCKVRPNGSFKANRIEYFSAELAYHARKHLPVRYDPFDLSTAFARTKTGWIDCQSAHAAILAGRSEREVMILGQEILQAQKGSTQRALNRAQAMGVLIQQARSQEEILKRQNQQARDGALHSANPDLIQVSEKQAGSFHDSNPIEVDEATVVVAALPFYKEF